MSSCNRAASHRLADGKPDDALQQMASAADHEDKTDKHNVTPGVILPARELLGDMLLHGDRPDLQDARSLLARK